MVALGVDRREIDYVQDRLHAENAAGLDQARRGRRRDT